MNAAYFRQLYAYHFALNRKLWHESIMTLSDEQFVQDLDYSVGSIRNQVVHLFSVDNSWFSVLRGEERAHFANPVHYPNRDKTRTRWDEVEAAMQGYLDGLTDDALTQPFHEPLVVWEVLLHVANHGTDHRAQLLAMLHSLGAPTFAQDYVHWRMGRL